MSDKELWELMSIICEGQDSEQRRKVEQYITVLQKEIERLNNIIKEVREYIEKYLEEHIIEDQPDEQSIFYDEKGYYIPNAKEQLLNILDKGK